jgi:hypothetical protein
VRTWREAGNKTGPLFNVKGALSMLGLRSCRLAGKKKEKQNPEALHELFE